MGAVLFLLRMRSSALNHSINHSLAPLSTEKARRTPKKKLVARARPHAVRKNAASVHGVEIRQIGFRATEGSGVQGLTSRSRVPNIRGNSSKGYLQIWGRGIQGVGSARIFSEQGFSWLQLHSAMRGRFGANRIAGT